MAYHKMTPELQYQYLVQQNEDAKKSVQKAGTDLEYLNGESMKGFNQYYDKILFYSAGAFSFTLALVNIVAQQESVVALTKSSFILPNIFWLYFSWSLYLLACVLIILNKKLHAVYLGYIGMGTYAEKIKELRKTEAAIFSFEKTSIVSVTGSEDAVERITKNADEIQSKEKENKLKADFYYKLKMRLATVVEGFALLATALLFFASILITQTFIWG